MYTLIECALQTYLRASFSFVMSLHSISHVFSSRHSNLSFPHFLCFNSNIFLVIILIGKECHHTVSVW